MERHSLNLQLQAQTQEEAAVRRRLLSGTLVEDVPRPVENMDPRRVMEELIILRNRLLVDAPAQAPEGGWREAEEAAPGQRPSVEDEEQRRYTIQRAELLLQQCVAMFGKRAADSLLYESHGVEFYEEGAEERRPPSRLTSNIHAILALLGKKDGEEEEDNRGSATLKKANKRIETLRKELQRQERNLEAAHEEIDTLKQQVRTLKRQHTVSVRPAVSPEQVSAERTAQELEQKVMYLHDDYAQAVDMQRLQKQIEEQCITPEMEEAALTIKKLAAEKETVAMVTKLGEDVEQMLPGIAEVLSGGLAFASWVLDSKAALRERMGWLEMETRELMAPLLPEQGPIGNAAVVCLGVQDLDQLWSADARVTMAALKLLVAKVRQLRGEYQGYEASFDGANFTLLFQQHDRAWEFAINLQHELLKVPWPAELAELPGAAFVQFTPTVGPRQVPAGPSRVVWAGLRVRCALHCGPLKEFPTDGKRSGYAGAALDFCGEMRKHTHGGQILISEEMYNKLGGPDSIRGVKMTPLPAPIQAQLDQSVLRAVPEYFVTRESEFRQPATSGAPIAVKWQDDRDSTAMQLRILDDAHKLATETQTAITVLRNLLERQTNVLLKMKQNHAQVYGQLLLRTQEAKELRAKADEMEVELTFLRSMRALREGDTQAESALIQARRDFQEKEKLLKRDVNTEKQARQRLTAELNMVRMVRDALASVYGPMQAVTVEFLRTCAEQFTLLMKDLGQTGKVGLYDRHYAKPPKVDFSKYDGQLPDELIRSLENSKFAENEVSHNLAKCWAQVAQLRAKWQQEAAAAAIAALPPPAARSSQPNSPTHAKPAPPPPPPAPPPPPEATSPSHRQETVLFDTESKQVHEGDSEDTGGSDGDRESRSSASPRAKRKGSRRPGGKASAKGQRNSGPGSGGLWRAAAQRASQASGASSAARVPSAPRSVTVELPAEEVPVAAEDVTFDGFVAHSSNAVVKLQGALDGLEVADECTAYVPGLREALLHLRRHLDVIQQRGAPLPLPTASARSRVSTLSKGGTGSLRPQDSISAPASLSDVNVDFEPEPPPDATHLLGDGDGVEDELLLHLEEDSPGLATMIERHRLLRELYAKDPDRGDVLQKIRRLEADIASFSHIQRLPFQLQPGKSKTATATATDRRPKGPTDVESPFWDPLWLGSEAKPCQHQSRERMRGKPLTLMPEEVRQAMERAPAADEEAPKTPVAYKQSMWEEVYLRKRKVPGQAFISKAVMDFETETLPASRKGPKAVSPSHDHCCKPSSLPPLRKAAARTK